MAHYDIQPFQSSRAVVNGASLHSPRFCLMDFPRNDAVGKSKKLKHLNLEYFTANGKVQITHVLVTRWNVFSTLCLPTEDTL